MSQQVALRSTQRADLNRTVFAVTASLVPLLAIMKLRTHMRLDNLHVSLVQALVVLFFRFILNLGPVKEAAPAQLAIAADDKPKDAPKAKRRVKKRKAAAKPKTDERYSEAKIDDTLHRFLSVVDPSTVELLPPLQPGSPKPPAPLPLTEWKQMHHDEEHRVTVYAHPSIDKLFAISTLFVDVPMRNLWELLIDVSNRPGWDKLTEKTETLLELGPRDAPAPTQRQASVSWLGMLGMWPVKAKDLVLLSVVARIPPKNDKGWQRLVCATSSTTHDDKPTSSSYQRMELSISGFVVEEEEVEGKTGVRLTQLTDLSGLGWVPGKVLNVITQQMIPKSLARIGKQAKEYQLPERRAKLEQDDWLPPLIGKLEPWPGSSDAAEVEAGDDEELETDDEDEDDGPTAADARTINELIARLRLRLASVDSSASSTPRSNASSSASTSSWLKSFWPLSSQSHGAASGIGGDQAVATRISELFGASAIGGAAGAAAVFGLALLWGRRAART